MVRIELEDKGQDLLWLEVNNEGVVEKAGPFQDSIWRGSIVPYCNAKVGDYCPIHCSPDFENSTLRYKIVSIESKKSVKSDFLKKRFLELK